MHILRLATTVIAVIRLVRYARWYVAQKMKSKKKKRDERGKIKKKERKEGKESGPEAQKVGPERGWGPRQRPRYILEGCDLCYAWFRCETFCTSFNPSATSHSICQKCAIYSHNQPVGTARAGPCPPRRPQRVHGASVRRTITLYIGTHRLSVPERRGIQPLTHHARRLTHVGSRTAHASGLPAC